MFAKDAKVLKQITINYNHMIINMVKLSNKKGWGEETMYKRGAIRVIITWEIEMDERGRERERERESLIERWGGGGKKNGHTFSVSWKLAIQARKRKGKGKSAVAIQ